MAGSAIQAAVINESFARRKFPGQDPVGQRLSLGAPTGRPWSTIVGVVGDVKQTSLAASRADSVYIANEQSPWADGTMWLVVRTPRDPAALTAAVKRAVWSVDKDQPIVHVAPMDTLVAASAAERRFALVLFEASPSPRWCSPESASMACSPAASKSRRATSACARPWAPRLARS